MINQEVIKMFFCNIISSLASL